MDVKCGRCNCILGVREKALGVCSDTSGVSDEYTDASGVSWIYLVHHRNLFGVFYYTFGVSVECIRCIIGCTVGQYMIMVYLRNVLGVS